MGEDTARRKSLLQMTIRRNLECLIRLGPNIRAFDTNKIPQEHTTNLLQSLEYALLGCRMILANFTPKPLGLRITPETIHINEKVRLETIGMLQANEDLVHKRLPSKLVRIIKQAAKHKYSHHNSSAPLLDLEKEWIETIVEGKRDSFLAACGYARHLKHTNNYHHQAHTHHI